MEYDKLKNLLIITCEEVRFGYKANESNEPGKSVFVNEIAEVLMLELPREIIERVKSMGHPLDDYEEAE